MLQYFIGFKSGWAKGAGAKKSRPAVGPAGASYSASMAHHSGLLEGEIMVRVDTR